jgi:ABC-type multidrug transport system fused ATPase/permease subunit
MSSTEPTVAELHARLASPPVTGPGRPARLRPAALLAACGQLLRAVATEGAADIAALVQLRARRGGWVSPGNIFFFFFFFFFFLLPLLKISALHANLNFSRALAKGQSYSFHNTTVS